MSRYLWMLMTLIRLNCETVIGDGDVSSNNIDAEMHADYWIDLGRKTVEKHVDDAKTPMHNDASNMILVVGSGMSLTTIRAAGILNGLEIKNDFSLSFEKFPTLGFAKSHCVDSQVGDNACTSTAYLGGFKGKSNTIGMSDTEQMDSIAQWAIDAGKDVGIVTTSRVTHASVAGTYGHAPITQWESDADVMKSGRDSKTYPDLAYQLIHGSPGNKFKVILGGGRESFLPENEIGGQRKDSKNLIDEWKNHKIMQGVNHRYVSNKNELLEINNETQYLLGLFNYGDLSYHMIGDEQQPSLEDMVDIALDILSKNKKGYFLFVLGGRIDDAHRANQAKLALDETIQLSKAVDKISSKTNRSDTLIVVTADHGNTMTISGYPSRWNNIVGISDDGCDDILDPQIKLPTLSYGTGPGYREGNRSANYMTDYLGIGDPYFKYPSNVMLEEETHGGEDVPVFVKGPWQEIFSGCYEMDALPHMIGYIGCIGPGEHSCKSSGYRINPSILIYLMFIIILYLR